MGAIDAKNAGRLLLGGALAGAGLTHLTIARQEFRAQVPDWASDLSGFSKDDIVLLSGAVEMALGTALMALPKEQRRIGWIAAAFLRRSFQGTLHSTPSGGMGLDWIPMVSGWRGCSFSLRWWRGRCGRRGNDVVTNGMQMTIMVI